MERRRVWMEENKDKASKTKWKGEEVDGRK